MKNSIYGKIRRQVLAGSFAAAVAVCLAAVICIAVMRGSIIDISNRLGNSAAGDSKTALEVQMEDSLLRLARNKAVISNEKLAEVAKLTTRVAQNAGEIMADPAGYLPRPADFPDGDNAGRVVSQLRLPEGAEGYAALAEEIGLLGNISGILTAEKNSLDYVRSVYIGSENGVSISADVDSDLKTDVYDPREREWYLAAKEAGELVWTEVFADNSGRGLSITCASPFFGSDGTVAGVAGAGMQLTVLTDIVVETRLGETGYAFIANEQGDIIIADSVTVDAGGIIQSRSITEMLPGETAGKILGGGEGIERVEIDGESCFIAYARLEARPWSLAVVMSVDEVIAPAIISENNIISMTDSAAVGIDRMLLTALGVFAAVLLLTFIGNTVMARQMAARLARPIIELSDGAKVIGAGNLNFRPDIKTGDELEELSNTFNAMIDSIHQITADKERIGAELNVATRIQASMLPCIFPAFPERPEFDIYATMLPAKEVGGDFYDFFLIDENKLAVVIADVSGKGVPAALFMVIAKTLIKNNAQYGKSPGEVFETVNDLLCENNEAGMFVTAFMGVLDIKTGAFTYVNAGHNPPLIKRAGGNWEWLPTKPSFVLAGMEDMIYKQEEIRFYPGDMLYLYTDGVTEAENRSHNLFSDAKLLETANRHSSRKLKGLLAGIKEEIDIFADGMEQSDDITMLAMIYTGEGAR